MAVNAKKWTWLKKTHADSDSQSEDKRDVHCGFPLWPSDRWDFLVGIRVHGNYMSDSLPTELPMKSLHCLLCSSRSWQLILAGVAETELHKVILSRSRDVGEGWASGWNLRSKTVQQMQGVDEEHSQLFAHLVLMVLQKCPICTWAIGAQSLATGALNKWPNPWQLLHLVCSFHSLKSRSVTRAFLLTPSLGPRRSWELELWEVLEFSRTSSKYWNYGENSHSSGVQWPAPTRLNLEYDMLLWNITLTV